MKKDIGGETAYQSGPIRVFRPTILGRVRVVVWMLLGGAFATIDSYIIWLRFFSDIDAWGFGRTLGALLLLIMFFGMFCYSAWRLLILSFEIGPSAIVYKSLLREFSVRYVDFKSVRLQKIYGPRFTVALQIWHSGGSLYLVNMEFSGKQLSDMKSLIDRNLVGRQPN